VLRKRGGMSRIRYRSYSGAWRITSWNGGGEEGKETEVTSMWEEIPFLYGRLRKGKSPRTGKEQRRTVEKKGGGEEHVFIAQLPKKIGRKDIDPVWKQQKRLHSLLFRKEERVKG